MAIGFATYGYSDWFFEGKNVTTLGASAVVMILINAQAWPFMLENIQHTGLEHVINENEKVRKLIDQLDIIVEVCSSLTK